MKFRTLLFVILFLAPCSPFAQPLQALFWRPVVEMSDQIFPSYVWANANRNYLSNGNKLQYGQNNYFGDSEGQIGVVVEHNVSSKQLNLRVVVTSPEIMEPSEFSCSVQPNQKQFEIFPEIKYKWSALSKMRQPMPQNISISVYVDGQLSRTENKVVTVRSINDCPFMFIHRNGVVHDMNFMFAAYVNENNPVIADEILPSIFRAGTIKQVIGYQGTEDDVFAQIYAVWKYLRSRGVAYSSLTSQTPISGNLPIVVSQYVRTFEDAYNSRQANCVDGTVLMASILYKMGLKPLIVLKPGHCFLGVVANPQTGNGVFVETTMINMVVNPQTAQLMAKQKLFNKSTYYSVMDGNDFYSFTAAVLKGNSEFNEIKSKLISNSEYSAIPVQTQEKLNAVVGALRYQIFEVEKYRVEGLLPITSLR